LDEHIHTSPGTNGVVVVTVAAVAVVMVVVVGTVVTVVVVVVVVVCSHLRLKVPAPTAERPKPLGHAA
jgi:hypothetical protein